MADALAEVKVGYELVVVSPSSSMRDHEHRTIAEVTKLTPTQVELGGKDRYRRKDGRMLGGGLERYRQPVARLPLPGEIDAIRAALRAEHEATLKRLDADREAQRGRATGYLLAGQEALEGFVKGHPDDKVASVLLGAVWSTYYDLRRLEGEVLRAESRLRSQADELARTVKHDSQSEASFYQGTAATATEAKRVTAREHAATLLRLTAALLGTTVPALIAPMVKPKAAEVEGAEG
jgi:hypothetical protein